MVLTWWIEWGPKLDLLRSQIEKGKVRAWNERPILRRNLTWIWRAWRALSGSRTLGFGVAGPISFLAIDAYARRYYIVGDDFEALHYLIVAMDEAYLAVANRKE